MRRTFSPHTYYHIFNRGFEKRVIFHDERDYQRFLFSLLFLQKPISILNTSMNCSRYFKLGELLPSTESLIGETESMIELINFCIMPNHFHITIKTKSEAHVSRYLQKVLASYTKYYNKKYERDGFIFGGPFKHVEVSTEQQLLYLSAYIHRNPVDLVEWQSRLSQYPWSSYSDYVNFNRWGDLLRIERIMDFYQDDYGSFVMGSGAKQRFIENMMID